MLCRRFLVLLLCVAGNCVVASPASAWNAAGHRTITSIIWRRLTEERRRELVELLRHHPRYQTDFVSLLPANLQDGEPMLRGEWFLQQASVWPDIVRSGPPERIAFNQPQWHYLPRAFYLTEPEAAFRARAESGLNSRLEPVGGAGNPEWNGPQAFQANWKVLNDPQSSTADRAVALCWVLHLGEDLHQPCHTASLCTPRLFPDGDRGGNRVKTKQQQNLHAVWDSPLGPDEWFETCRERALVLLADASSAETQAVVGPVEAELVKWVREGLTLEREAVYVGDVRDAILKAETGSGPLPEIALTADYLRNVRRVSDRQFVAAGVRLSQLLK